MDEPITDKRETNHYFLFTRGRHNLPSTRIRTVGGGAPLVRGIHSVPGGPSIEAHFWGGLLYSTKLGMATETDTKKEDPVDRMFRGQ